MHKDPTANEVFRLLDTLNSTIRDAVAREETLNADYLTQKDANEASFGKVTESHDEQAPSVVDRLASSTQQKKAAYTARYEKRRERIGRAYESALTTFRETNASAEKVSRTAPLKEMINNDKACEEGVDKAAARLEEGKVTLPEWREDYGVLTAEAQSVLSGWDKLLDGAAEKDTQERAPNGPYDTEAVQAMFTRTRSDIRGFRRHLARRDMSGIPFLFAFLLLITMGILYAFGFRNPWFLGIAGSGSVALTLSAAGLRFMGKGSAASMGRRVLSALARADDMYERCISDLESECARDVEALEQQRETRAWELKAELEKVSITAAHARKAGEERLEAKRIRLLETLDARYHSRVDHIERTGDEALRRSTESTEVQRQKASELFEAKREKIEAAYKAGWQELVGEWKETVSGIYDTFARINKQSEELFPDWREELWKDWSGSDHFRQVAQCGRVHVALETDDSPIPADDRLSLPGPTAFTVPLSLGFPHAGSLLLSTSATGRDQAISALNNMILRLLTTTPPGKLSFTIFDPVELGQSFAAIMHLSDYEESLVNRKIWTQTKQIEQRLADLNEHMEKVIQMYLRNEYESISEYNEQAGDIAEKYHFVVIADFPTGFSDTAVRRLLSIAASGARCGVYTLIHWDRRKAAPADLIPEELKKNSVCLTARKDGFVSDMFPKLPASVSLDMPPGSDVLTDLLRRIGEQHKDADRVEVPFSQIMPTDAECWTKDTTDELRVPVGRTGATKMQYVAIGKGTCQHALVAGKTGSGKSTLFHVLITNLALWCSPDQVEFYLVDFKKGVEFKCYAAKRLPHARVVAIESDREFGISVLERIDQELRRRGDMFRELGVQDLAGYKAATNGSPPIPRTLLIVDEFQEFFIEDDRISQRAALLLDRIVRQGRAFGVHVILGSQTLGGAYTLSRTTLGQMVIRIALQCNEADAYLIMDDNNPAPRLLSRPGEALYNDAAGMQEGNSPFQVVWLPDQERDKRLDRVRQLADERSVVAPEPVIFEGNSPADIHSNRLLRSLLESGQHAEGASGKMWLGAPNSIKGPTEVVFHRQSGNNLLMVGQREEAALAIVSAGLVSLAAHHARGQATFVLFDGTTPGSSQREFLKRITDSLPHEVVTAAGRNAAKIIRELATEMEKRKDDDTYAATAPPIYVIAYGLQKHKILRYEEDYSFSMDDDAAANPAVLMNNLICEGTGLGFHMIFACDTYNNVNRFLSRKALGEFELRVLFQMSANDSAGLIDSGAASELGLYRAILHNEQEGYTEVFRPYALPDSAWVDGAAEQLRRGSHP